MNIYDSNYFFNLVFFFLILMYLQALFFVWQDRRQRRLMEHQDLLLKHQPGPSEPTTQTHNSAVQIRIRQELMFLLICPDVQ